MKRDLEKRLGHRFKRPELLETALTHRSHSHEHRATEAGDYERLEFLGDALLGHIVAEWLFRDDEGAAEGLLTKRRQSIVRSSTLAGAARRLGLGEAVQLGRGEERTGGRAKSSLLADTFEAVLAAVYLDGGIRAARAFVRRHLGDRLKSTRDAGHTDDDFKTRLQETIQARLRCTPRYRIVSTSGPPHARVFEVEVVVRDVVWGRGKGSSRKEAEQRAAREALQKRGPSRGGKG